MCLCVHMLACVWVCVCVHACASMSIKIIFIIQDWTKHWFVLNPNFLRYYRDSASEGSNQLDGAIDLSAICRVSEVNVSRNYGFKLEVNYCLVSMIAYPGNLVKTICCNISMY